MITEKDLALLKKQTAHWLTPETLPISFWLGEEKIISIPARFAPKTEIVEKDGVTDYVFTGTDPATGLMLETTVTLYAGYPAADIVTWLTNTGKKIRPCSMTFWRMTACWKARSPICIPIRVIFARQTDMTPPWNTATISMSTALRRRAVAPAISASLILR